MHARLNNNGDKYTVLHLQTDRVEYRFHFVSFGFVRAHPLSPLHRISMRFAPGSGDIALALVTERARSRVPRCSVSVCAARSGLRRSASAGRDEIEAHWIPLFPRQRKGQMQSNDKHGRDLQVAKLQRMCVCVCI